MENYKVNAKEMARQAKIGQSRMQSIKGTLRQADLVGFAGSSSPCFGAPAPAEPRTPSGCRSLGAALLMSLLTPKWLGIKE